MFYYCIAELDSRCYKAGFEQCPHCKWCEEQITTDKLIKDELLDEKRKHYEGK